MLEIIICVLAVFIIATLLVKKIALKNEDKQKLEDSALPTDDKL